MLLLCPICKSGREPERLGRYENRDKLFADRELFECSECGLIFVHPMPTPGELRSYYETVWFSDEEIISTSKEAKLNCEIQADERLKYMSRHIDLFSCQKVLDVGSGYGYLYDSFKKRGMNDLSFYATDLSPANIKRLRAKGISSFTDLRDIKEQDFDLVTISSVLEHVGEPVKFMRSVIEYVRKGGYIFIDLPERDDLFKPILEPHVAVYTKESLTHLAGTLGLKTIHLTGYGRERSKLIAELNHKEDRLTAFKRKAVQGIRGVLRTLYKPEESEEKKIRGLYRYYKYDEEGTERWWIRAIFRKED